jgi:hypothetical protein
MADVNGTVNDALNSPHNSSHGQTILIAAVGVAILYLANKFATGKTRDPREPPIISPGIPFIGHLVGMVSLLSRLLECMLTFNQARHQAEYWISLR